jgi:ribosomal protein S27AE
MKDEERCPRCGGNLLNKTDYDYVFDINYQMCLQCGKILYDENDGF